MTYLQAILIGALQGVTELFPVSSLGHSILIPRPARRLLGTQPEHVSRRRPGGSGRGDVAGMETVRLVAAVCVFSGSSGEPV
jgi:hypothetical protein